MTPDRARTRALNREIEAARLKGLRSYRAEIARAKMRHDAAHRFRQLIKLVCTICLFALLIAGALH